jgi:hypothetical protein
MPETQGTQTQQTIQLDTQVGDNQRVFQFDLPESDNVIG